MENKRYSVKVKIQRRNFDKTNAAKFKADLYFVSNEYGVIYDWKIVFSEVHIDLFSTPSWFEKKITTFKRRKALFDKLNLQQLPRPKGQNKIIELNKHQIKILNDWMKEEYKSTLKNIIGLLKGNNPGGEAKKPQSAEIVLVEKDMPKNFVILFDDLVMKKRVNYDATIIGAEEITFKDFIKLQPTLENAFNYMQNPKKKDDWLYYLKNIKEYYKKFNDVVTKAEAIANKARRKYTININNKINRFPFGLTSSKEFQKCHIIEYHDLRDKIINALIENTSYLKYEKIISDENNFIPLPEHIHRQFDRKIITYKPNGEIWALNEEGYDFLKHINEKFKKIDSWFLNDKRKKYIEERNENLIF